MKETETRNAAVRGTVIGLGYGVYVSSCLIALGLLLCVTGIGAIIGIPLIIIALISPIVGGVVGLAARKGECPWCGTTVTHFNTSKGIDCPTCKKRIVIKKNKYIKIE